FLYFWLRPPPTPPLFPYTTLFRSHRFRRRHDRLQWHRRPVPAVGRRPPSRAGISAARRERRIGGAGRTDGAYARSPERRHQRARDRKSTRLNSSHLVISYAVFCLK